MFPIQFPTSFLAASVPAEVVAREQALLAQLQTSEPANFFEVADRLTTLYRRHIRTGGIQGNTWISSLQDVMARRVEEEELYGNFLEFRKDQGVLRLPPPFHRHLG